MLKHDAQCYIESLHLSSLIAGVRDDVVRKVRKGVCLAVNVLLVWSVQTSLACMFCFPNTGHTMILKRIVSLKFRLIHVRTYALFMKRQRSKFS